MAERDTATQSPILQTAAIIAMSHHEKWDGSGYPHGLTGEAIPIEGRITAVADVFDALSSRRLYKAPLPLDRCFDMPQTAAASTSIPRCLTPSSPALARSCESPWNRPTSSGKSAERRRNKFRSTIFPQPTQGGDLRLHRGALLWAFMLKALQAGTVSVISLHTGKSRR